MNKESIIDCGPLSFVMSGRRVMQYDRTDKTVEPIKPADMREIIECVYRYGFKPKHNATKLGFLKRIIREMTDIDLVYYINGCEFSDVNIAGWIHMIDLQKTCNMSKSVYEKFEQFVQEKTFGGFGDKQEKTVLKKLEQIMSHAAECCVTEHDCYELFHMLLGGAITLKNFKQHTKMNDQTGDIREKILSLRDEYFDITISSQMGKFIDAVAEIESLRQYRTIPMHDVQDGLNFRMEGKTVKYIDYEGKYWPPIIETNLFEFINRHEGEQLGKIFNALMDNGIECADIMRQCRNDVLSGADIRDEVEHHTFVQGGIFNDMDFNELHEYHPEISLEELEGIWYDAMCENFEDIGDYMHEKHAEVRRMVADSMDIDSYDRYEDRVCDSGMVESYYEHCYEKLSEFICSEKGRILEEKSKIAA